VLELQLVGTLVGMVAAVGVDPGVVDGVTFMATAATDPNFGDVVIPMSTTVQIMSETADSVKSDISAIIPYALGIFTLLFGTSMGVKVLKRFAK
jgi:hypothetical protein